MTLTQINKAGLDELALDHVFTIGASGSSAYTFQGEGLNGTVNNPTLYLTRGKTYRFENGSGGHPIRIQSTSGASGTAYNTGVTNNAGSGTVIVEVQHDAPDVLYYQCTSHAAMNGILYITGALADGGVTTAKLADDAVTDAKLANSINSAIAANTAKTTNATHTGDVTGSGALTIANDAVTTSKIADDAVTADKLANNAVTTASIANAEVTNAKLAASSVGTNKIADDAVTTSKINANAVTTVKINDNAVTTAKIQASNVTTAKIADGAVTNGKLATDSVTNTKIADDAITTAKIQNSQITTAKIADANITNGKLASNSVTNTKIADDAITTAKIQDQAVTSLKIANGTITAYDIADGAVVGAKLADGSVVNSKIGDDAVTAAKIGAGACGTEQLANGAVTAAKLASGVGGGIVKLATRRYYGFDQTTGISNAGFTRMDKAFVTITPSSASNYIRLGGVMNWSGSDTENQYSFRWRREISGGATTSLDSDVGSGLRPGIQFRLLGNGDVATLQLQGVIDYPNTTSAVTYYIEVFVDGSGQNVYLNRGQNDSNDPRYERAASYFTAEEISSAIHTHTNTNS